jgi:hypothetical protein
MQMLLKILFQIKMKLNKTILHIGKHIYWL